MYQKELDFSLMLSAALNFELFKNHSNYCKQTK